MEEKRCDAKDPTAENVIINDPKVVVDEAGEKSQEYDNKRSAAIKINIRKTGGRFIID